MEGTPFVYFLAHKGADTDAAMELRNLLHPDISVFLDACDLSPGDRWDVELPRAQQQAKATVALLSSAVEPAYYLQEEIANAVAFQRHDPDTHRLIPVYLKGLPADPRDVPYGVRVRHALDAEAIGLDGVAAELRKWAGDLKDVAPASLPAETPKPAERMEIYEALSKVLLPQLDEIMFRLDAPTQHLAPPTQPQARRALDLVQWAEAVDRLNELADGIRTSAPGILR